MTMDPARFSRPLCVLCPILGAAGFFFRTLQLRTGFEADTSLAIPGNLPDQLALLAAALTALCAALAALALPAPKGQADLERFRFPFRPTQIVYAALTAAAGLVLFSAGPLGPRLSPLLAAVCLMTALYALLLPLSGRRLRIVFLMEHTLFYVVLLILLFSRRSTDPVWMDFWPQLLALCAVALALCALSAAACGVGKIRRGLFFLLCGGAWSIIAAADCCTPSALPALLLFAAAAVLLLSCALRAAKGGDTP